MWLIIGLFDINEFSGDSNPFCAKISVNKSGNNPNLQNIYLWLKTRWKKLESVRWSISSTVLIFMDLFTDFFKIWSMRWQKYQLFLTIIEHKEKKVINGHCQFPLPLRNLDITIPNNKSMAEKNLVFEMEIGQRHHILWRLGKVMDDLISKGRVPQLLQKQPLEGKFCQIPHCGIWDICLLTKSRKIRVVIVHRLSDFRVMY